MSHDPSLANTDPLMDAQSYSTAGIDICFNLQNPNTLDTKKKKKKRKKRLIILAIKNEEVKEKKQQMLTDLLH